MINYQFLVEGILPQPGEHLPQLLPLRHAVLGSILLLSLLLLLLSLLLLLLLLLGRLPRSRRRRGRREVRGRRPGHLLWRGEEDHCLVLALLLVVHQRPPEGMVVVLLLVLERVEAVLEVDA